MNASVAAIAAVIAAAPCMAAAEPVSDAFKSLCLVTGASPQAVKSAASAQGFVSPPERLAGQLKVPNIDNATTLMKLIDGGMLFVVWGNGAFPVGASSLKADVCAVGGAPQIADPVQTLQAMLDVGPPVDAGASKVFLFNDKSGARTVVKPEDSAAALTGIAGHQLRMAAAQNNNAVSTLMLIAPIAQ